MIRCDLDPSHPAEWEFISLWPEDNAVGKIHVCTADMLAVLGKLINLPLPQQPGMSIRPLREEA